jgi:peptidylprolyl isomerase
MKRESSGLIRRALVAPFIAGAATLSVIAVAADAPAPAKPPTMTDVLAASKPSDWHALDPQNTLYLDFSGGRVVIELAPAFAPRHVANIRTLVREKYFDGLAFLRSQDNYVVQWGDPHGDARAEDKDQPRSVGSAQRTLKAEFTVPLSKDLPFTRLPDIDGYAPEVGFSGDFWAARDPNKNQAWLTHCYGALGVGRDVDPDSGGGTELYVVIGNAPRHLDRNITLVGRVLQGMELLSTLPRGTGPLGFYEKPEQRQPIEAIRLAADVPAQERVKLEVLRTDTPTFHALVETRRNRRDEWFHVPAGYVELCNVPIPVRAAGAAAN